MRALCGLAVVALLVACCRAQRRATAKHDLPWFDPTLPLSERVALLVNNMTIKEVSMQLSTNFDTAAPAIERLGVPSYDWRNNFLHGLVDNGIATMFPQAIGLAATWSTELLTAIGRVGAVEQRAKYNINKTANGDVPMNYGLNVWQVAGHESSTLVKPNRSSNACRGQETYGEDPVLTGTLGVAIVKGLQTLPDSADYLALGATPKHFVAYSLDKTPPRLSFDPTISMVDLRQTYFPAFKAVVQEGRATSLMCRFVILTTHKAVHICWIACLRARATNVCKPLSMTSALASRTLPHSYNGVNGYPMCASPMLDLIVRNEWGFDGFFTSDSDAIVFFVSEQNYSTNTIHAAAAALNAGVDLNSGPAYLELHDAYEHGLVTEQALRTSAERLFTFRLRTGEFDPDELVPFSSYDERNISSPVHQALNLRVAEESLVLLKNSQDVLPLDLASLKHVAIIGLSTTLATNNVTFTFEEGCDIESNDTSRIPAAVEAARQADVVFLVLGLHVCTEHANTPYHNAECEGHDRESIGLPGVQKELAESIFSAHTRVITIYVNGGPVASPIVAERSAALLEAWYGGQHAGTAVSNIIFGKVSPSGRLPYLVPPSDEDLPDILSMTMSDFPGRTYRYFQNDPLHDFGFGLSYTRFEYAAATMAPLTFNLTENLKPQLKLEVTVRNVGKRAGKEVVQVYARLRQTTALQERYPSIPLRQLLAFTKTGELKTSAEERIKLEIVLSPLQLANAHGELEYPEGVYDVFVGGVAPPRAGAPEELTRFVLRLEGSEF
ncbi:uncharacterized protein MONBRDRAFT_33656 [Monosiga brevicollis MX1]|uniref:Fibronectin type III-like domain-containing protein n=1 Tax=Monosiga brevicollis TaxID=81824 RepID=A9V6U1_MONBE|nr:uncharacterized protein MONBRDRAFT_33656 [Monosiga brevicollis MX1]EDQ86865.1 predicted protein [Monosiga brevicollis MX1]|eukprot:XP_001748410.1 hypothetical protein [Monosiga brevicollis MX1]